MMVLLCVAATLLLLLRWFWAPRGLAAGLGGHWAPALEANPHSFSA